jgi:glycosyltransferase involved in cell wall biosynthesis
MKIWHITQASHGGSGQYAVRLSAALSALGHQSTVLLKSGNTGLGIKHLYDDTNPTRRFANRAMRSILNRVATEPFHSGLRLDQWVLNNEDPPDIIHLHGLTGWIGFEGLRTLIPPHTPVFWTAHDLWMLSGGCVVYNGCENYQTGCHFCPSLKPPFSRWSRLEWLHKSQFVQDYNIIPIANSNWMANCIRQSSLFSNIKDIPIIPPIIAPEFFEPSFGIPLRAELGIPSTQIVIGLGARTVTDEYKGIGKFLEHFSQSSDLCHRSTIIMFGDGKIETPSNVDCRFLGRLSAPEQVKRFFQACNVFVSPSRMETFGMTLVEAQASETPVLTFRVGGTPDAVYYHEWLAEVGDYESLICSLHSILEDLEKAHKIGVNAALWTKENFLSQIIGEKQISIYCQG